MKGLITLILFIDLAGTSLSQNVNNVDIPSMLMLDGRVWMVENLSVEIPDSYCQQDDSFNCVLYGRLYTWEAAKNGCDQLGDEWQLPTDTEWQALAKRYGGIYTDAEDQGNSAYLSLTEGGKAGFNALLGGNREPNRSYDRLGAHGFYWTLTEHDSTQAWFYNFAAGAILINRHKGDKGLAISVRCIKRIKH